jgi:hypothetical protein
MVRRVKKEPTAATVPAELTNTMKFIRQRFQFNIQQIEKRYANKSSGLVFNMNNDQVSFC